MPRNFFCVLAIIWIAAVVAVSTSFAQETSGIAAASAIERTLVDVIARTEKSVVAIARVRKDQPGDVLHLELRPDPFSRRPVLSSVPQPTDPDFIPNEYGTGVAIDRRGLILKSSPSLNRYGAGCAWSILRQQSMRTSGPPP